jgi:molybdopterin-guanine dinucleotide biosynthesis protein A
MGRDKALLPCRGATLVGYVAVQVRRAAGSVALVGPPERFAPLGLPVIRDHYSGAGPLAGIQAALASSAASWNLIVACDMPSVTADFLEDLLGRAECSGELCLLPVAPGGRLHPLCAAYHRDCLPALTAAIESGARRVRDVALTLKPRFLQVPDAAPLANVNTPEEWSGF